MGPTAGEVSTTVEKCRQVIFFPRKREGLHRPGLGMERHVRRVQLRSSSNSQAWSGEMGSMSKVQPVWPGRLPTGFTPGRPLPGRPQTAGVLCGPRAAPEVREPDRKAASGPQVSRSRRGRREERPWSRQAPPPPPGPAPCLQTRCSPTCRLSRALSVPPRAASGGREPQADDCRRGWF